MFGNNYDLVFTFFGVIAILGFLLFLSIDEPLLTDEA